MLKTKYFRLFLGKFALPAYGNFVGNSFYHLMILLFFLVPLMSDKSLDLGQTNPWPSIGQIQGPNQTSPYLNKVVTFRGVVTGIREDENLQGTRYYTVFMQDLPEFRDSARSTSDGIAVFFGRKRPPARVGDVAVVSGLVTEYYGLTEIDDKGLTFFIEDHGYPIPDGIELNPPEDVKSAVAYFERLEGMLVKMESGIVVGPTHVGCGFSVVPEAVGKNRIMKHERDADVGQIVNILNWTDVDCSEFPSVQVGDKIHGLEGPLTYHFEEFKLVQQRLEQLSIENVENHAPTFPYSAIQGKEINLATFNLHNYFDSTSDTGDPAEPIASDDEREAKQKKLSFVIANILKCPTILAVQEVEKLSLLDELAARSAVDCNFTYTVSHLDSVDLRGADVAMLSDPRYVRVTNLDQHQYCTTIETGIIDPSANCPEGSEPLFSRQPLQVDIEIDQIPFSLIVVHFKSKRGGEDETEPRRLAQAAFINQLVERQSTDSLSQNVIVLGDFNDYYNSSVMKRLRVGDFLTDQFELLPENQRYSYIFDGASQLIDGILVSQNLENRVVQTHIFHINSDYPNSFASALDDNRIGLRSSDHDIPMITLRLRDEENSLSERKDEPLPDPNEVRTPNVSGSPTLVGDETNGKVENMVEVTPTVPVVLPTVPVALTALTPALASEFQPTGPQGFDDTDSEQLKDLDRSGQSKSNWSTVLLLALAALVLVGIWLSRRVQKEE